ncbi:MAG: dCTP deaminase [Chloroflexota bacterium]
MSILNERDILRRMVITRDLIVTPVVDMSAQLGPTSLDVRLGTSFQAQKRSALAYIEPLQQPERVAADAAEYVQDYTVLPTEPYVLHPGEFALACTLEFIRLPADLAARLEGRSSWGRVGLQIHSTAGFIDPGFAGVITFELSNLGKVPIPLYPGLRVGQLSFYTSAASVIPYRAKKLTKYAGRMGAVGSAFYLDPEYTYIRREKESHEDSV